MTIGFILNVLLFAFIIWRFTHLYNIITAQTYITLLDKHLRWVIIFLLPIIGLTILLASIQKFYGIDVDVFPFLISLFKHSETVNMIALPIITIILAILSFTKINKSITFSIMLVLGFALIIFFDSILFSMEYVAKTDLLYDKTALWTYKILIFEMFIYAALMAITSMAVIYPDFESFFNESRTKDLKIIGVVILLISGAFFPTLSVMENINRRNDNFGFLKTTSDFDVEDVLNYFVVIENDMIMTEADMDSFFYLFEDEGGIEKLTNLVEASNEISESIKECILYNDENCLIELLDNFLNKKNYSKSELLYNHEILDIFLYRNYFLSENPFSELLINNFFYDLLNIKFSDLRSRYYKISLLKNYVNYSILYELNDLTPSLLKDYEQYVLDSFVDNPYLRLYGISNLAVLYSNLGSFHIAEKTLIRAKDDFENFKHLADNSFLDKRYFSETIRQIPVIFGQSILRQRPSSELAIKLFKDFMDKDAGDGNLLSYMAIRPYYEVAMSSLGYLLYQYPEKGFEIRNEILTLIEKNKSRGFKKNRNAEWIKFIPEMSKNQAGLNYITSNYVTLGQYYDADTTISFIIEIPNPDDLKLSEIWTLNYAELLNIGEPEELTDKIKNQLIDMLLPQVIKNKIKNKNLIVSPDGIIQEIPFQWLLNDLKISSLRYIPGFSFIDNKPKEKNSSLLAIAVPNPDVLTNFDTEGNYFNKMFRGQAVGNTLLFAKEEVVEIIEIAKNYDLHTKLKINPSETWVKNEISKYEIVHFATHSVSSSVYGEGKTGVFLNKDKINDGFLSEEEIGELNLNGQMVYLSSCESGLGEYMVGEGLLSIARAFLSAGAGGVVSSLWLVNDKSAKDISVKFYSNYFHSGSPEIALFNAQKDYKQSDPWLKYPFTYTSY